MPFTPALMRQKQAMDLCVVLDSLVYRVSSRPARDIKRCPFSKNKNKNNTCSPTVSKNYCLTI